MARTTITAQQALDKVYGDSNNFMTPRILETGWLVEGEVAYEVSYGRFLDKHLYGISLARRTPQGWQKWTNKTKTHSHPDKKSAKDGIEYKLRQLKWQLQGAE